MSLMILPSSTTATVRRALAIIESRRAAHHAPKVLWQAEVEDNAAFDHRVAVARGRLPPSVRLIAVCSGPRVAQLDGVTWCELPPKLLPLLHPAAPSRYRCAYGGRGGAKSWAFVRALLMRAITRPIRVLCFREFQTSIAESVLRLIADQISALALDDYFTVQATSISGANGSEFVFSGVKNNINKIRSLEGIDIAFGEEAVGVSENSWQVLVPTIRKSGSEIWCVFNPDSADDPTFRRFVTQPPDTARVVTVNYLDNPWLPAELDAEQAYLARVDADAHAHVWLGATRAASDAQVFRGKFSIEAFEPQAGWDGPYLGCDWGFSVDPTTLVKCWVSERKLYVEHECYAVGCDLDRTPALFDQVPDARRYVIRADSARPETISHMQQHGYPRCTAVEKWGGSVEDGIAHLRSYEQIVVHPRCVHVAEEMRLYSYKTDRLSGDVLAEVIDKNNHTIDALRYALGPLIRKPGGWGLFEFYRQEAELRAGGQAA